MRNTVAERIREAAAEKSWRQRDLAVAAGISPGRIHEYWNGPKAPGTSYIFAIANALGVSAEWLAVGSGPKRAGGALLDAATADWLMLPRYDLLAFTPDGKPEPVEQFPIRRDWLAREARYTSKVWICEMPSGAMPDVADQGAYLLCRDIDDEELVDGRVYVFLLDARPIVRRLQITPKGMVLRASDPTLEPMTFRPAALEGLFEGLVPIGRVLGSIALRLA